MRRLIPGRMPSSRLGRLCAAKGKNSRDKNFVTLSNIGVPCASKHPGRMNPSYPPAEKKTPKTQTKKNEPTPPRNNLRPNPREKGGLIKLRAGQPAGGG